MFDWTSDVFKNTLSLIGGLLVIFCMIFLFGCGPEKSNLEKLNSIEIDCSAAGADMPELQKKLMNDPISCRVAVDHHSRRRFMLVNHEQMKTLCRQFTDQLKKHDIMWSSHFAARRCRKIVDRLSKVVPDHCTRELYIVDTPEVNAFCVMDNVIIVFRGLLDEFNDDELTWVIAHEMGHSIARHQAEMMSKKAVQNLAINAFSENGSAELKMVGSVITAVAANLKYSRTQENEADRLALLFMNKAGYNMQGAVTALNKFKAKAGENSKWAEMLSTHPHPENRLKNVKKAIAQLEKNPDTVWGGVGALALETAKIAAIKLYMQNKEGK